LGRLYYNNDLTERAIGQFKAALNLNPQYSNSRYSLAIAYEKQGKINEALEQLEIVSEANPANQEIKDRIIRLRIGTSEPKEEINLPEEEEEGVLEEME
jgi:tetratricopeptide (TPR) repeat protein